mgnify:CR=1 FL=1
MKIAFFTEGNAYGQVPRNFPNMRTDMAWICALDAIRVPYMKAAEIDDTFDLGICIIPKELGRGHKNWAMEDGDIAIIKTKCKKVVAMQEGPHWYFQDYKLDKQIRFFNILMEMDGLLVHNELDKTYFEGLTNKKCTVMKTLMIEDLISDIPNVERSGVMIGGNFCSWYGGFDSYIVAQQFGTEISVPSMGRKIDGEEQMQNLSHMPYMNWTDWITELSKRKYGVHLMRTHAAGTFALNCAYLGIPCIGYKGLDTQMICHPDCTIEVGDLVKAKQIAEKLRIDEEFYLYCSNTAIEKYKEHYHEDNFKIQI